MYYKYSTSLSSQSLWVQYRRRRVVEGWEWGGGGGNYFALSNLKITQLPQLQSGPHYTGLQKRGRNTRLIKTKRESRDGREDNISMAGVDLTCLWGECLHGAGCVSRPALSQQCYRFIFALQPSFYRPVYPRNAGPDAQFLTCPDAFAPPGKSPLKDAGHFLPPVRSWAAARGACLCKTLQRGLVKGETVHGKCVNTSLMLA